VGFNSVGEVKRCILITGMHRSGTSCLTGTAQQAGLHLGRVHTENPHNIKGNRENPDAMRINDGILEANQASWDDPRLCKAEPRFITQCQTVVDGLHDQAPGPTFGLKDPRLLFTFEAWEAALAKTPLYYLISFRHPLAVARSLNRRNGWGPEQGLALWFTYNQQALEFAQGRPVRWVNFDWEAADYKSRVLGALAEIGVGREMAVQGSTFYEPELVHHHGAQQAALPQHIAKLHAKLCTLAALPKTA